MKTITKRELNQQTAKVLAAVAEGEAVEVTERGKVRWRIESTEHPVDPIARLEAEGRITRAKENPAPWPERDPDVTYDPARIDELYEWSRGDR